MASCLLNAVPPKFAGDWCSITSRTQSPGRVAMVAWSEKPDYPTSKRQTAPIWIGGRGSARMARWRSAANDRHTVARLQASARTPCDRRAVHERWDLARVVAAVSEAGGDPAKCGRLFSRPTGRPLHCQIRRAIPFGMLCDPLVNIQERFRRGNAPSARRQGRRRSAVAHPHGMGAQRLQRAALVRLPD